jgi:hypothetical protein
MGAPPPWACIFSQESKTQWGLILRPRNSSDFSLLGSTKSSLRVYPTLRTSKSSGNMLGREVSVRDGVVVYLSMAFLAVTFGELMTGGILATPFSLLGVFLVPPFVVVSLTYGLGVLLVREASVRIRKGWAGTLLLGAANAWVLQGIFTKVIFGPASSPNIGPLGSYGHWLGVSWVYVVIAIYFDAILATVVPIFLTSEVFPRTRDRRLLSDLGVAVVAAALVLLVAWEDIYINANNGILPSAAHPFASSLTPMDLGVLIAAVAGLSLVAWKLPKDLLRPPTPLPVGSPWSMMGIGLAFTVTTLFVEGFAWQLVRIPAVVVAGYGLSCLLLLLLIRHRMGRSANLPHRVALVAGCLVPWLFVDVMLEVGGDFLVLPIAIGVFTILAVLWRRGLREAKVVSRSPVPALGTAS